MRIRNSFTIILLIISTLNGHTQALDNSAAINKLEAALANAKNKVAIDEKKINSADSIIEAGKKVTDEAKEDIKNIDEESKKYEKDFASRYKDIKKLTGSKDKTVAKKAALDLRALDSEHRTTNRGFETKMNNAYRKQATGYSIISKGQKAKNTAKDSLTSSLDMLKAAQKNYDSATEVKNDNGREKGKSK